VRLLLASSTPIQRHVKVKSTANPYDPVDEPYFEKREADHMAETFRGTRTLRFLWKFQRGFCPECNTKITRVVYPYLGSSSIPVQGHELGHLMVKPCPTN